MVASVDTVQKIIEIIGRHVDRPTLEKIVDDLMDVPGNQSFRDTVQRIRVALDDSKSTDK